MSSTSTQDLSVAAAARWLEATYRVSVAADRIEDRAQAIAIEQSIEAPLAAVGDQRVLDEVVARVASITPAGPEAFDVKVHLAVETTGCEPGQLMNMLFGNTSMHDDVALIDAEFPTSFAAAFGGPRFGVAGIRNVTGVHGRPLTCAALKPQGLAPPQLAAIAHTLARAGIDVIKDDHGLANQDVAPFNARVSEVQRAIDAANRETGGRCVYAPSLNGHLGQMRDQVEHSRRLGVRMFLIAPMISGVATLAALARECGAPLLAHPAMTGGSRISQVLLQGKLFRLFGADATIFANAGGRFSYSTETCDRIAQTSRRPWHGLAPTMPVPAGGMSVARVPDMRANFGDDTMLLIGGSLLTAREHLFERTREFVVAVKAEDA
jgi:S-methyl-5-thioribulose 1-phosphate isomerase